MSKQAIRNTPSPDWAENNDYTAQTLERVTPHGVFRAIIQRDEHPEAPDFEMGCPIVRIETNRGYTFRAEMTGYGDVSAAQDGLPDTAANILERFRQIDGYTRTAIDTFERYLKIFHDGSIYEYGPNQSTDSYYVAYVTRAMFVESWGNTGEVAPAEMGEYVAWLEGDVYGVGVEKAIAFDEDGDPIAWAEVDDIMVWGHYGEDWAKRAAEDDLEGVIARAAKAMLPLEDVGEDVATRLEYLRGEIRAQRISQGELHELQGLAEQIDPGDVELLEWAGVPEFPEGD